MGLGPCTDSLGNQPSGSRIVVAMARNNTSDAQHATHLRGCALASAQIIQFAPYLAQQREQEVERLLARLRPNLPWKRNAPCCQSDCYSGAHFIAAVQMVNALNAWELSVPDLPPHFGAWRALHIASTESVNESLRRCQGRR
jgi:hypothetical protein